MEWESRSERARVDVIVYFRRLGHWFGCIWSSEGGHSASGSEKPVPVEVCTFSFIFSFLILYRPSGNPLQSSKRTQCQYQTAVLFPGAPAISSITVCVCRGGNDRRQAFYLPIAGFRIRRELDIANWCNRPRNRPSSLHRYRANLPTGDSSLGNIYVPRLFARLQDYPGMGSTTSILSHIIYLNGKIKCKRIKICALMLMTKSVSQAWS